MCLVFIVSDIFVLFVVMFTLPNVLMTDLGDIGLLCIVLDFVGIMVFDSLSLIP